LARIFISHSSANNAAAIALSQWLLEQGYDDVFLDIDPKRGLMPGVRWQAALKAAADRCESVLFLVTPAWLASRWCRAEFDLARLLHKQVFGVVIEPVAAADLPVEMAMEWQLCHLVGEGEACPFDVEYEQKTVRVEFRQAGLDLLRRGLARAGLDARSFPWPPKDEPLRAPYRGMKALEPEDAAIFFGRNALTVRCLDALRGIVDRGIEKLFVVLGASGSGKSSFLRAGLWPRLARDDTKFLPLPVIRPQLAVISGTSGLAVSLAKAFERLGKTSPPGIIKQRLNESGTALGEMLDELLALAKQRLVATEEAKADPTVILAIDQAEELFNPDGAAEAARFLEILGSTLAPENTETGKSPRKILLAVTIRSDRYERLQNEPCLEGVRQHLFNLPPIPQSEFKSVIEGPAQRVEEAGGKIKIEPALVERLIADAQGADALPLLGFTLERLYADFGAGGVLTAAQYDALGGVQGSIQAAIQNAFAEPGRAPAVPAVATEQLACLRAAFVPWLARIDPQSGAPLRRVARLEDIPQGSRSSIERLVEARLIIADARGGVEVREIAHESLLRRWSALTAWLAEDAADLTVIEGIERASNEWVANGRAESWLDHRGDRLIAAEKLLQREDFRKRLGDNGLAYLSACRGLEDEQRRAREDGIAREEARLAEIAAAQARTGQLQRRTRRVQVGISALFMVLITGIVVRIYEKPLKQEYNWYTVGRPYMVGKVQPHVLKAQAERGLQPGDTFKECADVCPEMIVIPPGEFMMGSPDAETETYCYPNETPQHKVEITQPFAVSKFPVTFEQWDMCAINGDCDPDVSDSSFGHGRQPLINITWDDAQRYVAWLSKMTGKLYRLLTEAEWEYAARAGTTTAYTFGDDSALLGKHGWYKANSDSKPHPVGTKHPNPWGLHDMEGNVWQWVQDCYNVNYLGAPTDGSAWTSSGCSSRVLRGGSWISDPKYLRSACREYRSPDVRSDNRGLRVARSLGR
jgi:formylglycine-generating enzyme required for sulfatase activity